MLTQLALQYAEMDSLKVQKRVMTKILNPEMDAHLHAQLNQDLLVQEHLPIVSYLLVETQFLIY